MVSHLHFLIELLSCGVLFYKWKPLLLQPQMQNGARQGYRSNAFVLISGDDAVADDYASIAMYFENQKQYFLAGKFFLKSAQYAKVRGT